MFGHFLKWRSEIPLGGGDMRGFYMDVREEKAQPPCKGPVAGPCLVLLGCWRNI